MSSAVCLVWVPPVRAPDSMGNSVDYNVVYEVLKPAPSVAGFIPVRADVNLWRMDQGSEPILQSFSSVPFKFLSGAGLALTHARQQLVDSLVQGQSSSEGGAPGAAQPVLDALLGLELARRQSSPIAVQGILGDLERAGQQYPVVLIDAMLSYRVIKAWRVMVEFIDAMPPDLRGTAEVQEQKAYALNQDGRGEAAERTLQELISARGKSPGTMELLGWVYRTRWEEAMLAGAPGEALEFLQKSIQAYLDGFLLDPRNALDAAGNAVTLMEVGRPDDPRREQVTDSVWNLAHLLVGVSTAGYTEHATLLEVAAIKRDESAVGKALDGALHRVRAPWQPEETARNLWLVHEARARRGEKEFQPAVNATWALRTRAVARPTAVPAS